MWFQLYQLYLQDPFDHLEGETDAEEVDEIQETMDENLHDQVQQAAQDMQPAEVEKPTDADVWDETCWSLALSKRASFICFATRKILN